jgi:hypothetical protein
LSSCEHDDDITKLKSYIFYIFHHSTNPNSKLQDFDFQVLIEGSKKYFYDFSLIQYLELALDEIRQSQFNPEEWTNMLTKRSHLAIENLPLNLRVKLRELEKDPTEKMVFSLIENLTAPVVNQKFFKDAVFKTLRINRRADLFPVFLELLRRKSKELEKKTSKKKKHKESSKSILRNIGHTSSKRKSDNSENKKGAKSGPSQGKVWSGGEGGIWRPTTYTSENEDDILHTK